MKRSDLVLGKDYYYNSSNDWESYGYRGQKVTYVSTDVLVERLSYRRDREPIEVHLFDGTTGTASGNVYAHASSYDAKRLATVRDEKGTIKAVPLVHLRGPYEECKARVDAYAEARERRQAEERERMKRNDERLANVKSRLADLGLGSQGLYTYGGDVRGLTLDVLERLLAVAEHARENDVEVEALLKG